MSRTGWKQGRDARLEIQRAEWCRSRDVGLLQEPSSDLANADLRTKYYGSIEAKAPSDGSSLLTANLAKSILRSMRSETRGKRRTDTAGKGLVVNHEAS